MDRSGHARSVDEQQADNARAAAAEGWSIVTTYADPNRSASRYATRARENYQRLLADISAGHLDVLIMWESSRGSREVNEWVDLIDLTARENVLIHVTSHGRTYDPGRPRDRRSMLEDAVDSDYESGKVSERVKRATAASAAAGRPFGSIPYGFRREYETGSSSPVRQVPDETTGPVVREIVARVLAGDSLHGIAVDLNRRGVPTPQMVRDIRTGRGGVTRGGWNNPKLRKVLSTPTIAGWRVHRGEVHGPAGWEPLITDADFDAVRMIIDDPTRRTQRGTAPKYLLSGIAVCGVCGGWLRRFPNRGHQSYGCAGVNNTTTGHVVRRAAPLDALAVRAVVGRLSDPELPGVIARSRQGLRDAAEEAAREVAALRAQVAEFEAVAAQGSAVSAASFARVVDGLHSRLAAAQARAGAASGLPSAVLDLAGPDAAARWARLDGKPDGLLRQRTALRALLRIVVHRSGQRRGVRGFDESSVQIDPR